MEKNDKDDINVESPWYYFYSQGCAYCKQLEPIIEELNHNGTTLIVVTHDTDLGLRAGRRIRMVDGRIVEDNRA